MVSVMHGTSLMLIGHVMKPPLEPVTQKSKTALKSKSQINTKTLPTLSTKTLPNVDTNTKKKAK